MKIMVILQFITWLSVCPGAFAAEPTNTPVRVTISQSSRPPQDRIVVTSSNMIARLMTLFPGYEGQPAEKFLSGGWPVSYTIDIAFADGHSRTIYVSENRWTAGAEKYTPMAQNWDELMGSMTTNFFKRTWSNMQRLGQVHEPTTLIIGPCETVNGRGGDMKGQPDGPANGSQPVEGVSVRLRADKARWASNEIATFRVDVRNQGQREFYTFQSQEAGFLQVDGVWYHWTGAFDLKGSALPPKREYRDIPVSLGANWTATLEWRDKTKAPPPQIPLQVPPGKHTIRFAPEIRDITMKPKPQNNYLPSNPVEIEIEGNLKKPAEPDGPANGSQPVGSDPNRTPAAAGSGR